MRVSVFVVFERCSPLGYFSRTLSSLVRERANRQKRGIRALKFRREDRVEREEATQRILIGRERKTLTKESQRQRFG